MQALEAPPKRANHTSSKVTSKEERTAQTSQKLNQDKSNTSSVKPEHKKELHHIVHNAKHKHRKQPSKEHLSVALKKFANAMQNFAFLEVITGLAATVATNFHSGWFAWSVDSVTEALQNGIIGSNKGIPKIIPKWLINIVKAVSNEGVSFHSHSHGVDDDHDHEHHEGCIHTKMEHDLQEKVVAFLTLAGSIVTLGFSLIKPMLTKVQNQEVHPDGLLKFLFKTILPVFNSGVMLSSGIVKARLGNLVKNNSALNNRLEDYFCGGGALLLTLVSQINKLSPKLANVTEMIVGSLFSLLSLTNAVKGLGYNISMDNIAKILGTGNLKLLTEPVKAEEKYELLGFEKSSVGDAFYDLVAAVMEKFGVSLPNSKTIKEHEQLI